MYALPCTPVRITTGRASWTMSGVTREAVAAAVS
jgi:hypothetical protein